mmetsp:Transcript_1200/g.4764  ORF Transcript_1200/g.4764 Transcript_1200/m.4764 type:complete len:344 (+) Transcript_1200:645-1676(+)
MATRQKMNAKMRRLACGWRRRAWGTPRAAALVSTAPSSTKPRAAFWRTRTEARCTRGAALVEAAAMAIFRAGFPRRLPRATPVTRRVFPGTTPVASCSPARRTSPRVSTRAGRAAWTRTSFLLCGTCGRRWLCRWRRRRRGGARSLGRRSTGTPCGAWRRFPPEGAGAGCSVTKTKTRKKRPTRRPSPAGRRRSSAARTKRRCASSTRPGRSSGRSRGVCRARTERGARRSRRRARAPPTPREAQSSRSSVCRTRRSARRSRRRRTKKTRETRPPPTPPLPRRTRKTTETTGGSALRRSRASTVLASTRTPRTACSPPRARPNRRRRGGGATASSRASGAKTC